jgi:WD40 repeat protein
VWDFATGREMVRFTPNAGTSVTSVAFSPDGRTVLTGSDDSFTTDGGDIARLWDVATGRELRRFAGHSKQINSVAFSPDGHSALTGSRDRTARLWDIATGQEIRRFGHSNDVNAVAFSPDGKTILTGSADSTARLWDAATGQELRRFFIPKDLILAVAFSGDGRSVLTGSFGNTVRLWNVATGVEIRHFEGHTSPVDSVVFSPDDRLVLTGSWDGTAKIWNSDSGDLVATLVGFRDGGWAVISPDGRYDTGDVDGASALSWIADDDPDTPLPLEIFMRQYYTPRLRPRLLAGEKLPALPNIAALNRVQPGVKIVKVEADPKNSDNVRVVVEVKAETRNGIASGAKDLRLFRNGQMVAFREGDLKDGQYVFEGIRLAHRGPKVPVVFTAYAFNTSLIKSATATATHKLPDTWPERRGRVFLVDIGINRTLAKGCNLQYAVSDADAMRGVIEQRLQASGYAVEAQLLTADDRQPNGASKDHLRKVLADIAAGATPDDLFVLTYSGHGYTDATGTFYLLPSDLKGDCARVDRELLASAISSDDLTEWIRPIDAGEMVMVLDACYSAASIESGDFKPGPMGNPGLGQLAYDKRIRVLAASQATQPAGEAGALGMGYLSYSLVKNGLEGNEADWQPKDGAIWLREWLEHGVDRVPRLYENVREGKDTVSSRGIVMRHNNAVSLQTPALFDFRTAEDHGVQLNGVQLK